jgi:hypothetical protein
MIARPASAAIPAHTTRRDVPFEAGEIIGTARAKGLTPVSISQNMHPKAKMSERASTFSPSACSRLHVGR